MAEQINETISTGENYSNTTKENIGVAVIPLHILYDTDLTIIHLRLYSEVERMESLPPRQGEHTIFCISLMAEKLEVSIAKLYEIIKTLKEKGYVDIEPLNKH